MRIFDVYEHPSFEVDNADKVAASAILRRLGVGFTLSSLAAIGFCLYYWSELGFNQLGLSATSSWPTGRWGLHHSHLRKGAV